MTAPCPRHGLRRWMARRSRRRFGTQRARCDLWSAASLGSFVSACKQQRASVACCTQTRWHAKTASPVFSAPAGAVPRHHQRWVAVRLWRSERPAPPLVHVSPQCPQSTWHFTQRQDCHCQRTALHLEKAGPQQVRPPAAQPPFLQPTTAGRLVRCWCTTSPSRPRLRTWSGG